MKKVIVYGTPTCHFCHAVQEFLKSKNVDYEYINVAADREKLQEMVDKSGQMGVPVVQVGDDEMVVGFNQAKLSELLGI